MRILILAAAAMGPAASSIGAAQVVTTPTEREIAQCLAEEKQRDALALRRFGQRTRADSELRQACQAEVARRFDDRVLGRTPQPGPPPIPFPASPRAGNDSGGTGAVGSILSIQGEWRSVGTETTSDNRFMYFIDTALVQREGSVASAWLTWFYERPYPDGAASTAWRVRVDCRTGQWARQLAAIRDGSLRVLRQEQPDRNWQPATLAPLAPLTHVRRIVCAGEAPGYPVPRDRAPGDVAREWFTQNPR